MAKLPGIAMVPLPYLGNRVRLSYICVFLTVPAEEAVYLEVPIVNSCRKGWVSGGGGIYYGSESDLSPLLPRYTLPTVQNLLSYSTAAVSVFAYLHKEPHGRLKTIIRSITLKIY